MDCGMRGVVLALVIGSQPMANVQAQDLKTEGQRQELIPSGLVKIARVTGKSIAGEQLPNPNQTDRRFDVGGTDLGIIWDMGEGQTGIWFGDTYGKDFVPQPGGGPGEAKNWRSNVLAFSSDTELEDGLSFSGMVGDRDDEAKELLYGAKNTSGEGDWTSIPTAAIRVNGVDYVHFMNIRKWLEPGNWSTNYSAVYASSDGGKCWQPTPVRFDSRSNFSQVGFARQGGYVYMLGTKPGRLHAAYLARIPEQSIQDMRKYEYWNKGKGWIKGDESQATAVVEDAVGELSLLYHTKYKRWILTYLSGTDYRLFLRDAEQINGVWSSPKTLVKGEEYPGLYGAFLHPMKNNEDTLYFLMSEWGPYNVFLMKVSVFLH